MRTGWFVLADVLEATLTRKAHASTAESHNPTVVLLVSSLFGMLFIACQVPPQQANRFTAEEAAYDKEIAPLATASCGIGTYHVSATRYVVTGLEVPGYGTGEGSRPWIELHAQLDSLLPPPGLEDLHAALMEMLSSQLQLPEDYPMRVDLHSGSRLPTIDGRLDAQAKVTCSAYRTFLDTVALREPEVFATSSSPTFAVSFQPIGSPLSVSLNSKGGFAVSVSDSIPTSLGTVNLSTSNSTASPVHPTRLVINAGGHRRAFLMDRPFKVFVPSEYGVAVANDGQQLTLDILSPAETGSSATVGFGYRFTNLCSSPVDLAIHYMDTSDQWRTEGWWSFAPGESAFLSDNAVLLTSNKATWYFYARTTDNALEWGGDNSFTLAGASLGMREMTDTKGDSEWYVSCG